MELLFDQLANEKPILSFTGSNSMHESHLGIFYDLQNRFWTIRHHLLCG